MNDFIIKRIEIKNFRAFENFSFDTDGKNIVFITGRNGLGKTTIFDAIEWCFTGEVKKVFDTFKGRNTKQTEKNKCIKGIIQNKNLIGKPTSVAIFADYKHKGDTVEVTIIRTATKDAYEIQDTHREIECSDNDAKEEIKLKLNNFYQTNICDRHKEVQFLSSSRENIYELFKDFLKDRKSATIKETISKFNIEIDEKISNEFVRLKQEIEKKQIELSNINNFELIEYPQVLLYAREQTNVSEMTSVQLKDNIKVLKDILNNEIYVRVEKLSKSIKVSEEKTKIYDFLTKYNQIKKDIDEYYKQYSSDKSFNSKSETKVKELNDFINLIKIISVDKYIDTIKRVKKKYNLITDDIIKLVENICLEIKSIDSQIQKLGESSKITESLLMLVKHKQSFIDFKNEGNDNCPLCGSSENFKDVSNICWIAQEYLERNDAQKLALSTDREEKLDQLNKYIDNFVINPLKQQKQNIKNKVETYKKIGEENQELIAYLESKDCGCDNIYETLNTNIASYNSLILNQEAFKKLHNELKQVCEIKMLAEAQLGDIPGLFKTLKKDENILDYRRLEIDIIIKKLLCLEIHQKNIAKLVLKDHLESIIQQFKFYEESSQGRYDLFPALKEFKEFYANASRLATKADRELLKLQKQEIEEVSEMLNHIFQKLMKNNNIGDIKLDLQGRTNGKSEIKDDAQTNVLNTLSQGQMSVLMISYFLANLTIRKDKNIPIYLFDDITQSMDDLNINSFIDAFKYMLSSADDRLISQLFITTHDTKLIQIFEEKFSSRSLEYKTYDFDKVFKKG